MGWEVHLAKTAFADFAEEWDRLNTRLYDGHPFADSRFIGPLLDHFGDGSVRLCIHRTIDGISAALLLCPNAVGRWSTFRPSQRQATIVLLEDSRLLETLMAALPGRAWTIELHAVDPRYAPDFSQLALPQIVLPHARTIGIRQQTGFSDFWKGRPKKLAANIGRYFRRAEAELAMPQLSTLVEAVDMEAGIERFGELETAGWKGEAGTAVSRNNEQGAFYGEILRRFASTGQAAIHELYVGDHLASSRLVITNNHLLICLKTAYNEDLARFAPGRLLLYRVIEEQFALPAKRRIEFYTNATSDQKEWATFACTIQNIQIFRSPLTATVFSVLRAVRQNLRSIRHGAANNDSLSDGVKSYSSIETFKKEQYDLGDFSPENPLDVSLTWFELLEKHVYATDPGVRYYFTSEKTAPQVILPLRFTRKGPVKTIHALSNYYSALYTPLVSDEGDLLDLQKLLAAAVRDHPGAHVINFSPMDPESTAYKALFNALKAIDWIPFRLFCFGNWYLRVNGSWEDYLKKRSANHRSTIRRRSKRFAAEGGTLEIVTTLDETEQCIADYNDVYSASWKKPEPHSDFVPSLIRQLASMGMLRLGFARIKGRTIAAQLWIVDQQKASIYKVAYREDSASYAPGTVLTAHLMRHVIEHDRVNEVDFLIGDDAYKRTWMSDRRERWGIVAYNPATPVGLALLIKEALGRLVKSLARKLRGGRSTTDTPHPPATRAPPRRSDSGTSG